MTGPAGAGLAVAQRDADVVRCCERRLGQKDWRMNETVLRRSMVLASGRPMCHVLLALHHGPLVRRVYGRIRAPGRRRCTAAGWPGRSDLGRPGRQVRRLNNRRAISTSDSATTAGMASAAIGSWSSGLLTLQHQRRQLRGAHRAELVRGFEQAEDAAVAHLFWRRTIAWRLFGGASHLLRSYETFWLLRLIPQHAIPRRPLGGRPWRAGRVEAAVLSWACSMALSARPG